MLVLRKAEGRAAEGQRETPLVHRMKFEDLEEDLKHEYQLRNLKTWSRREEHLKHLRPVFKGMKISARNTRSPQRVYSKASK